MSDKDLVSRRRVLARKKTMYGWSSGEEEVVSVEYIESIPPVKQPMSAREFLTAYKRMCASYPETDCIGCTLHTEYKDCMDAPCEWDIDKILPAVEQWAREHPEEVNNAD